MKFIYYLLVTVFYLIPFGSFSQKNLTAQVTDESQEPVIGAQVIVTENGTEQKVVSDMDGNFTFRYKGESVSILVKSFEFEETTLAINPNQYLEVPLIITLKAPSNQLEDIVIKAKAKESGNVSLEKEKQNSAVATDGTSAEDIKKRPDTKVSDALKRISGASIQDNKFLVIRGLSDRYNFATINGSPLPSSESDKKAFSFDIFPSVFLDNIMVNKTATPDMPGEFAGGVISINTKNVEDKNFQTISISGTYNTLTTFRNYKTYQGSKTDWFGFDNGSRALPSSIPSTTDFAGLSTRERADLAKDMTPSWAINSKMALPNLNLQYGLNRMIRFGEKKLGIAFAYTYQNSRDTRQNIRREFEEQSTGVVLRSELNDSVFTTNVLNSAMLNLDFKINNNNKLKFKNIYSLNSEDKVTIRNGVREMDNNPHFYEISSNRWYTQNNMYTGQLEGEHQLFKEFLQMNWNLGYSDIKRSIPNMRRIVYQKSAMDINDPESEFTAVVQNNGTIPTAAGNMFWSATNEKIANAKYDFEKKTEVKNVVLKFKIGGSHQFRTRDFSARSLGFSRYKPLGSSFDNSLLTLPEDAIFAPENLGLKNDSLGGFKLDESTKVSDSYQASTMLHAGFGMIDFKFFNKLRFVGGARVESYRQQFNYTEFGTNIDRTIDTTVTDVLPSMNIIYSPIEKINIRLAYYQTVSRPEFRELAPFSFYNYTLDNILSGNPQLKRAKIHNAEIRFELYPAPGQSLSVSGFYKYFINPIELVNRTGTSGASELYYTNVSSATNFGGEMEYRIKLSTFAPEKDINFLKNTTVFTNFSLIRSRVDVSNIQGATAESRPLQGQSPYIVNAGLFFEFPKVNGALSISYNIVGRRIFIVGNVQEPDVWENHRHLIDLQYAHTFLNNKLEIKLNVRDLLAQKLIFYQDLGGNYKYDKGVDNLWQETTYGQSVSLGVSYKF